MPHLGKTTANAYRIYMEQRNHLVLSKRLPTDAEDLMKIESMIRHQVAEVAFGELDSEPIEIEPRDVVDSLGEVMGQFEKRMDAIKGSEVPFYQIAQFHRHPFLCVAIPHLVAVVEQNPDYVVDIQQLVLRGRSVGMTVVVGAVRQFDLLEVGISRHNFHATWLA